LQVAVAVALVAQAKAPRAVLVAWVAVAVVATARQATLCHNQSKAHQDWQTLAAAAAVVHSKVDLEQTETAHQAARVLLSSGMQSKQGEKWQRKTM
jgi:hypothetical protein